MYCSDAVLITPVTLKGHRIAMISQIRSELKSNNKEILIVHSDILADNKLTEITQVRPTKIKQSEIITDKT